MEDQSLHLKDLSLVQFKNHRESWFELSPEVNCFVGPNGVGKTNVLDAVYYLSTCKSYFHQMDSLNIQHDTGFFVVKGHFQKNEDEHEVYCGLKRDAKKVFKRNGKEYRRLADHIGHFPCVMISPGDTDLIREGSEVRRKFINSIISQYDRSYLHNSIKYNKVLQQRNALLKQFQEGLPFDATSLELWDEQLAALGNQIHASRKAFMVKYKDHFEDYHRHVSGTVDEVEIEYASPLLERDMLDILKQNVEKDRYAGRTTEGVHKDDLLFKLNSYPLKKFASQGQQKTFYIALKLAQYQWLKKLTGVPPMLLLDDIFDKLDGQRVAYLMKLVSQHEFGQIFITDTQPERVETLFDGIDVDYKVFSISEDDSSAHEPDMLAKDEKG